FTISKATPTVVAHDASGVYTGNPFAATATATGVGGVTVSGSLKIGRASGSTVSGTGWTTPPNYVGTFTVVASFTSGNPNYGYTRSAPVTSTISKATPSVVAHDASGVYTGNPFAATATATGVGGVTVSGSL